MGGQLSLFPLHHSKLEVSRWDLLPVPGAVCSPFILAFILLCLSVLGWDSLGFNPQGKPDLACATPPPPCFQSSHWFKEGQNCIEHPRGHHCLCTDRCASLGDFGQPMAVADQETV